MKCILNLSCLLLLDIVSNMIQPTRAYTEDWHSKSEQIIVMTTYLRNRIQIILKKKLIQEHYYNSPQQNFTLFQASIQYKRVLMQPSIKIHKKTKELIIHQEIPSRISNETTILSLLPLYTGLVNHRKYRNWSRSRKLASRTKRLFSNRSQSWIQRGCAFLTKNSLQELKNQIKTELLSPK